MNNSPIALVTGCTGMDAKTISHFLISKGYNVILTYRRTATIDLDGIKELFSEDLINNPKSSLDFIFMDIVDQSSIKYAIKSILENPKYGKIDEFYNFAAQSHVFESFKNADYTMRASGISVFYILESLKDLTPKTKFFQACTSEMFGGSPDRCPFSEDSPFETRSPYAVAKRVSYDWVTYFRQTYGMFACAAFCFNHSNIYRNSTFYIQKCCLAATKISLGKQSELLLGNLSFYRDESLSDFCIEGFWKMLQLPQPEDFVIGRGEAFSGEEFLNESFSYFNLDWKKYVKLDKQFLRDNEVVKLVANPSKAIKLLEWKPNRISLKNHIGLMCEYNNLIETGRKLVRKDVFKLYP